MIRELSVFAIFLFMVCVACWLILPAVFGSFKLDAAPLHIGSIAIMCLPVLLFFIIGFAGFLMVKVRSG